MNRNLACFFIYFHAWFMITKFNLKLITGWTHILTEHLCSYQSPIVRSRWYRKWFFQTINTNYTKKKNRNRIFLLPLPLDRRVRTFYTYKKSTTVIYNLNKYSLNTRDSGVEAEYFHFEYSLFPAYFSRVFIILCLINIYFFFLHKYFRKYSIFRD